MGPYNGVVEVIGTMSSCITLNSMMVRPSSALNPGIQESAKQSGTPRERTSLVYTQTQISKQVAESGRRFLGPASQGYEEHNCTMYQLKTLDITITRDYPFPPVP